MLGAIVGDVLGSIHEFRPVKTKDFELLNSDCIFTDDTVMTVAISDILMNGTPPHYHSILYQIVPQTQCNGFESRHLHHT